MLSYFGKLSSIMNILLRVPDLHLAQAVYRARLDPDDVTYLFRDRALYLKRSALKIGPLRLAFAVDGLLYIDALERFCNATFADVGGATLEVSIHGIRLHLQTWEELYIAHEVFVEGAYQFAVGKPVTVVDIGMNVGIASLFFASLPNVTRVHSYEPLPRTYARGREHIALNAHLEHKITTYPYGLGDKDKELTVDYVARSKGLVGIRGLPKEVYETTPPEEILRERIVVKSASTEIDRILALCGDEPLVLKIDCEGAEYEILRSMTEAGVLRKCAAVMIEWHSRGHRELTELLSAQGFLSLAPGPEAATSGMVYAVRLR